MSQASNRSSYEQLQPLLFSIAYRMLGTVADAEDGLTFALTEQLRCLRSEDFAEALKAMAGGRSPQWRGR
jgi:DNA-directed RNA polymerase specialized sigma24 family protein